MAHPIVRRWLLAAHLWLGLGIGAVLAVVALTGGLLVFYPEIDRLLVPAQVPPPAAVATPPDLDRVVAALRQSFPDRRGEWRLELPPQPGGAVVARHATPRAESGRPFAPLMVAVDPATGTVLTARRWGDTAMTWIYDLHYTLLAGDGGRVVLALVGLASLGVLASGAYLWWPAPGKRLRAVVPPRLRSGAVRRVYDLHVLGGVYGAMVVVPLVVTGVMLEQPDWFGAPAHHAAAPAANGGATANQAMATAQARFPQAVPRWVDVPPPGGGATGVRLYQDGEPGWRFPKTTVWVEATGRVVAVHDARDRSLRQAVFAWLHPLHNGEVFGLAGRIAAVLAGLPPPLLLVTGFLRWRHKRRAKAAATQRPGRFTGAESALHCRTTEATGDP